jgi:hypothetical protein
MTDPSFRLEDRRVVRDKALEGLGSLQNACDAETARFGRCECKQTRSRRS